MKNLLIKTLFVSLIFSTVTPAIQAANLAIGDWIANNPKITGISVVAAAGSGLLLRKAYKVYQAKKAEKEGIAKVGSRLIK